MKNEYYSSKKRFLAIILSLMMIFQMLPAGVLAEENGGKFTSAPTRASTYTITFQNAEGGLIDEKTDSSRSVRKRRFCPPSAAASSFAPASTWAKRYSWPWGPPH